MTGYEDQLHARAEMLDETGDLASEVAGIFAGAAGAGADPGAVVSLRTAIVALDPAGAPPGYDAGSRADRQPGTGFGSDAELLEAVSDAEEEIRDRIRDAGELREHVNAAQDKAEDDLQRARRDWQAGKEALAAAYALPTKNPCDGCHPHKAAALADAENAIADAERRIGDATRRISILDDATELLEPLTRRLEAALQALRQVPHDLGEVYELVYEFVSHGGKLPRFARWIDGQGAPA